MELYDVFEALVEDILDDFGENLSNGLLDLLVDSQFDVSLGVSNVSLTLLVILELEAIAVLVEVKQVIAADKVAVARVNFVLTFLLGEVGEALTLADEA